MRRVKKTIYYEDPLNDDFAGTKIKPRPFPEKYRYVRKNPFWVLLSYFLYYVLAYPILWIVGKIWVGVKVKGRKNLRVLRRRGVFFYGNHTQIVDAWAVQVYVAKGKRSYIVADQDAINIPGLKGFVTLLGVMPIPDNAHREDFIKAIDYHYHHKKGIIIYPEQHIWPYSTHIRNFPDDSFTYPAKLGAPVVAICTTYRRPWLFPNKRKPKMTMHVSSPFYPKMKKSLAERKKDLRDKVYDFMLTHSCEDENIEYIRYVKKKEEQGE